MITATPSNVRPDAHSLILFMGPPKVYVGWSLSGPGTLVRASSATNEYGAAYAVFEPTSPGDVVTVTVQYVP
jgi:hypothetical protein